MSNEYTEKDFKLFKEIDKECRVDPFQKVEYPPVAISMGETTMGGKTYPIPLGTYGNFSFIQAPPKTKKTFLVSLMSSVYLNDNVSFGGKMHGHREGRKLVHFDTEQGRFHASRVFKRPFDIAGVDNFDGYHTYGLRKYSYKERLMFIDYYLNNMIENVGLVIIDGIADLVSDVNDLQQSSEVVQYLMKWTEELNCHIITVIHSNFGSDKPTGHLGSFLEKKSETQIMLEANTKHEDMVTVMCKRSRSFPFEKFSFKVNEHGLPQIVGDLYDPLQGMNFVKVV